MQMMVEALKLEFESVRLVPKERDRVIKAVREQAEAATRSANMIKLKPGWGASRES